jgi:protein phosphatase
MSRKCKFAEYTHIGGRKRNEDNYAYTCMDNITVLVVADGMGGHKGGEYASRFFCEDLISLSEEYSDKLAGNTRDTLSKLIQAATVSMIDRTREIDPELEPHTTCVVAVITADKVYVTNLGDSRCYYLGNAGIVWRTRDHSMSQLLLDQGDISEDELARHPDQNKLYKYIGSKRQYVAAIKTFDSFDKGDTLLLCTDGLWTQCSADELYSLYQCENPDQSLTKICDLAVERGGDSGDNVTALLAIL